jgi:hypothetical protein
MSLPTNFFIGRGAVKALSVSDVFSVETYSGGVNGRTITNGIDLQQHGGMIWGKTRNNSNYYALVDSVRGGSKALITQTNIAQRTGRNYISSFNQDGYTVGNEGDFSGASGGDSMVNWVFRQAPNFFQVLSYVGDGTGDRAFSHNVGTLGMVIIKDIDNADSRTNYSVYHRSLTTAQTNNLILDTNATLNNGNDVNSSVGPVRHDNVAGEITIRGEYNVGGVDYVAYIFADNSVGQGLGASNQQVIKCGSYIGNGFHGGQGGNSINLGFEPQFLILKRSSNFTGADSPDWWIMDIERFWSPFSPGQVNYLRANEAIAEETRDRVVRTSTGFRLEANFPPWNELNAQYIYMAISS